MQESPSTEASDGTAAATGTTDTSGADPATGADPDAAATAADFDWLALDEGESVLWADTPHEMSLVPAMAVGLPLTLVLVGIPIVVGAYLSHRNTNYVVTTAALYVKTGVLSRNVQRIEFDKVQDTSYRQSFFGARFGYGTVDVSTAGGTGVEMSFANVADPQSLQSRINERIRSGRADEDDRDKAAVLDDILDELRAIRTALADRPADAAGTEGDEPDR
jgi:membrane protein YdbS with pleckstrin-like domain